MGAVMVPTVRAMIGGGLRRPDAAWRPSRPGRSIRAHVLWSLGTADVFPLALPFALAARRGDDRRESWSCLVRTHAHIFVSRPCGVEKSSAARPLRAPKSPAKRLFVGQMVYQLLDS